MSETAYIITKREKCPECCGFGHRSREGGIGNKDSYRGQMSDKTDKTFEVGSKCPDCGHSRYKLGVCGFTGSGCYCETCKRHRAKPGVSSACDVVNNEENRPLPRIEIDNWNNVPGFKMFLVDGSTFTFGTKTAIALSELFRKSLPVWSDDGSEPGERSTTVTTADVSLSLLIIDLGENCVVRVEKGDEDECFQLYSDGILPSHETT